MNFIYNQIGTEQTINPSKFTIENCEYDLTSSKSIISDLSEISKKHSAIFEIEENGDIGGRIWSKDYTIDAGEVMYDDCEDEDDS